MRIGSPGDSGVLDAIKEGLPVLRTRLRPDVTDLLLACLSDNPHRSVFGGDPSLRAGTAEDSISLVRHLDTALRAITGQTGIDVVLEAPWPTADPGRLRQLLPVVCINSGEFTAEFAEDVIPGASQPTEVYDQATGIRPASTTPHRSPAPDPARPTVYGHATAPGPGTDHPDSAPVPGPGRETHVPDPHRLHHGVDSLHWRTGDPTQWSVRDILRESTAPVPFDGGKRSLAEWAHRSDLHALGFIAACGLAAFFVVFLVALGVMTLVGP